MCVVERDGKVVIIDQSNEIDSLVIGLENAVQAVRLSGDKISGLRLRIMELEATLIDCRAEYLLLLDENPNTFAWDFDELSREDQDRYRKYARESLEIEEPIISIQLREAEFQVAALKKIAEEERAAVLTADICDGCDRYGGLCMSGMAALRGEPTRVDDYEGREERIAMARRQLTDEYPEIFGD